MTDFARERAELVVKQLSNFSPSSLDEVKLAATVLGWRTAGDKLQKQYIAFSMHDQIPSSGFWIDSLSIYWIGDGDVRLHFTNPG